MSVVRLWRHWQVDAVNRLAVSSPCAKLSYVASGSSCMFNAGGINLLTGLWTRKPTDVERNVENI